MEEERQGIPKPAASHQQLLQQKGRNVEFSKSQSPPGKNPTESTATDHGGSQYQRFKSMGKGSSPDSSPATQNSSSLIHPKMRQPLHAPPHRNEAADGVYSFEEQMNDKLMNKFGRMFSPSNDSGRKKPILKEGIFKNGQLNPDSRDPSEEQLPLIEPNSDEPTKPRVVPPRRRNITSRGQTMTERQEGHKP